MSFPGSVDRSVPPGAVIWAFPVAFLVHDIEEGLSITAFAQKFLADLPLPEAFKAFYNSVLPTFTVSIFLILVFITIITFLAWRIRKPGLTMYIYALFVSGMLANTVTHIFQALILVTYVPGLLLAVTFALPVAAYILYRLAKEKMIQARYIIPLIVAGFLIQLPMVIIMLLLGKLLA